MKPRSGMRSSDRGPNRGLMRPRSFDGTNSDYRAMMFILVIKRLRFFSSFHRLICLHGQTPTMTKDAT